MNKTQQDTKGKTEYTREELQSILSTVRNITYDDLIKVSGGDDGGKGSILKPGDDREEYTLDADEIERDIFGSKFCG